MFVRKKDRHRLLLAVDRTDCGQDAATSRACLSHTIIHTMDGWDPIRVPRIVQNDSLIRFGIDNVIQLNFLIRKKIPRDYNEEIAHSPIDTVIQLNFS